jgi:uncharacterized repeat protein (TIGR03803 family)
MRTLFQLLNCASEIRPPATASALMLAVVMLAPALIKAQSLPGTAYTFNVVYEFCSLPNCADGSAPEAGLFALQTGLTADTEGVSYGTTAGGGDPICGCGTVFKISKSGTETVLYTFTGPFPWPNGRVPLGGVIRDWAGNLYGTTSEGGSSNTFCGGTCGVVFKIDPTGQYTVLHAFTGPPDGAQPLAGLVRDAAGNLYGTTAFGGGGQCEVTGAGCGTVFKIDAAGNESVLYAFQGGADGFAPEAGLVMDTQGNLYGTTFGGGTDFPGTVFKVTPSGQENVLYTFKNGSDGNAPLGTLIMDAEGNLYGTTSGTDHGTNGTVFKLSQSGKETVLWDFRGYPDGAFPEAGVVMDKEGNLYGTTYLGGDINPPICSGVGGCGTVFEISKGGVETVLYPFQAGSDGGFPAAPLILDPKGNIYGTTPDYGFSNYGGSGNVFELIK